MLNKLKELNPEITFCSIYDLEFKSYGKILDIDTEEIVEVAKKFEMPENVIYMPSTEEFEALEIAKTLKNEIFGTLPTETGYCYSHSRILNATEWHTSNEINIAATDLVLILGHLWEIEDNKIDSSCFLSLWEASHNDKLQVGSQGLNFRGITVALFFISLKYARF